MFGGFKIRVPYPNYCLYMRIGDLVGINMTRIVDSIR